MSSLIHSFLKIMCLMCLCLTSLSRDWPRNMNWEHILGQWRVDESKTLFNKEPEALVHIFSKQKFPTDSRFVANPHHAVLPTPKEGPNFANAKFVPNTHHAVLPTPKECHDFANASRSN